MPMLGNGTPQVGGARRPETAHFYMALAWNEAMSPPVMPPWVTPPTMGYATPTMPTRMTMPPMMQMAPGPRIRSGPQKRCQLDA